MHRGFQTVGQEAGVSRAGQGSAFPERRRLHIIKRQTGRGRGATLSRNAASAVLYWPAGAGLSMTPEQINDLRRQKYNATVVMLRKVHPELMVMRVRPDFRAAAQARPVRRTRPWFLGAAYARLPGRNARPRPHQARPPVLFPQLFGARRRRRSARSFRRRTGSNSTSCWCARPTGARRRS